MKKKTLITVPSHGLGDVLYHSLVLDYLDKKIFDECILFCPQNCIEIPRMFNINSFPYYSKLLKNKLQFQIKSEMVFWRTLNRHRGAYYFSIFNDLIDKIVIKTFGFKTIDPHIGNYFLNIPLGSRAFLNRRLSNSKIQKQNNPKHFFLRIHSVVSTASFISADNLLLHFKSSFLKIVNSGITNFKANSNTVFIFPDASLKQKELTNMQVQYITDAYKESSSIEIYSNRIFNFAGDNININAFTSIKETLQKTLNASLVFSADSFPAHFSGLSGIKTIVMYKNAPFNKYCEYWGSPFNNVYHVEHGVAYKLDNNFIAAEINNSSLDKDLQIAKKVSELAN